MRGLQVGIGAVLGVAGPVVGKGEDVAVGEAPHARWVTCTPTVRTRRCSRRGGRWVEILLGHVAVGGEVAHAAGGEAHAQRRGRTGRRCRAGPAGGADLVRGAEPVEVLPSRRGTVISACTEWPVSGLDTSLPRRSTQENRSSSATSQRTGTARAGMPPLPSGASGSVASRVHKTKPSGSGSPEATPRLNGEEKRAATRRGAAVSPRHPPGGGRCDSKPGHPDERPPADLGCHAGASLILVLVHRSRLLSNGALDATKPS